MVDKSNISKDIKLLCYYCFDYLKSTLSKTKCTFPFPNEFKNTECPLFVTWKKGKDFDLRGCIGTFQSGNLENTLPKYALISSLQDTRFDPISLNELESLHVGVSLLVNFEDGKDVYDWEVGKHGIQIFYKNYNATFLPEVAEENNWDKKTTLTYLLNKSGCRSSFDKVSNEIKLVRYESYKDTVSYNQYKKYIDML